MISTEAKEISDDLGKLICWSKQYSMLEKESEWNDEITVFMRGLCESFWHESVLNYKDKELETALISISYIAVRPNVLIDILIELIEELKFSSISIIEKVNRDVLVHSKLGLIFDLFMRIVSGNIEKYDKYEREEVYNKIQGIELPHGDFEHEIYYYSIYAVVVSYLQPAVDRLIVSQAFFEECETMRDDREAYYSCLEKILEKELVNERYGWRNREILKYVINNLPNAIADEYIRSYFLTGLDGERESFYPGGNIMYLCLWKVKQCGKEYCKKGLDNLLNTHNLWISSAGRIGGQEENIDEDADTNLQRVYSFLDIESIDTLQDLFIRILIVFMLSDNSDTAENALRGIYHLLHIYPELVVKVEEYWDEFHYRAKEWMLMVYELLTETKVMDKVLLESLVTKHINDSDFNAAFYSRILLQRLCGKNSFDMLKEKQKYFADIPEYSTKKLLSVKSTEQYLTGTRYVMESLKRITEEMWDDCSDIESKVAAYMNQISDTDHMLLDVGGRKQCGVALYDINVAFLRVLYKEWYQGRWDGAEIPLSRIILSTSEPYVLLQSPAILPYQESKILNVKIDEFEEQDEDDKEEMLKNIFTMGISDDEIVLGGALTEYSYKKELLGFMTTYIDFPMMKRDFALYVCERNARLLIHRSEEFVEEKHCNLLVHNVGVESFKGSNIMCMFSKCALNYFGWEIVFDDGLKIVDSNNKMIGRFEYYYGLRTEIGNSVYMNQPVIQRWVVTNEAFTEIQNMLVYDLNQVADAKVFEF